METTPDDEDLFATLGGSLMKDLLADLNDDADAGMLSLEQLEKELAHLDSKPYGSLPTVTEETPSAASMVVAAHQHSANQGGGSLYGHSVLGNDPGGMGMDAWSLSLQKFTAASLEEDFLQADSARKAMDPLPPPGMAAATAPPGLEQSLSKAEEYDIGESISLVRPPPGLASSSSGGGKMAKKSVMEEVPEKLETTQLLNEPKPPARRPPPTTPQNSMTFDLPKPAPMTPQNSITVSAEGTVLSAPGIARSAPPGPSPPSTSTSMMMQTPVHQNIPPPTPPNSMHTTPHAPGHHPIMAVPVATPLPQAWGGQGMMGHGGASPMPMAGPPPPQMMMQQPPPHPVYANPQPDAPPVPANSLATRYMGVRDITYVVHSILKPILALGTSPFDYDQVYWRRRGQGLRPGKNAKGMEKLEKEMKSRGEKAKEWSDQHSTLGKSAKTNVARPRALIAQPVTAEGVPGSEEKQRQTLWKARIYCDQAYQAYMQVVETWEKSPGPVPANLQPHLVKLLRCLGIALKGDKENPTYTIDPAGLSLILKLAKGRVLLARLLEQALLPPASVQVLLPQALKVLYEAKPDPVDDRVFAAWSRVINSLPDLSADCIVESTNIIKEHTNVALQSTTRMQTVHGLLRRGSMLAANDPSFSEKWSEMESEFMKILGGM